MACKRLKLPYVLFFDADQILELDISGEPIKGLLRRRAKDLLHYNLKHADRIICVSQNAKNHLIQSWGVPSEKIVIFLNGVDVYRFKPDQKGRLKVRNNLEIAHGELLVIFVGNFYEWHDIPTLLDAFAQILQNITDVRLLLVGDGKKRDEMMKYAASLNIDHAIKFTGLVPHSEVPRLISAADIAVAPYRSIGQDLWLSPMKIFEYMASGTAIIASKVGQIDEIIQDSHNGLLFSQSDVPSLAAALLRLLKDKKLRSQLGQQARKDSLEKYSWESYVKELENLFLEITSSRKMASN
jgi:glycosyltransferase involved in cell wall biosynthesis